MKIVDAIKMTKQTIEQISLNFDIPEEELNGIIDGTINIPESIEEIIALQILNSVKMCEIRYEEEYKYPDLNKTSKGYSCYIFKGGEFVFEWFEPIIEEKVSIDFVNKIHELTKTRWNIFFN